MCMAVSLLGAPPNMAPLAQSDSDLDSIISPHEIAQIKRRNSAGPKYFCSIPGCSESFMRLDHLDRHEYHHTGVKKHGCTYDNCNKVYSILTHLKRHIRTTHERKAPPDKFVACEMEDCEKMFTSTTNMQRHIREVHENPKIYNCLHCGEKFTQKLKMRRHVIHKHTGVHPFQCSKCKKGFHTEWQYERHWKNCKIYPCPHCSEQFEKWTVYLKHCKDLHQSHKAFECEHCARMYAKPGELQKHIIMKHSDQQKEGQTIFNCTQEGCGRGYAYERNLKQHMLTSHSGKRFKCQQEGCVRMFSSAQNVVKHCAREHQGEAKKPKVNSTAKRKKRKDAGKSKISKLAMLSNLAVDKDLHKLLIQREKDALESVISTLAEEMQEDILIQDLERKHADAVMHLDTLMEIALEEDD